MNQQQLSQHPDLLDRRVINKALGASLLALVLPPLSLGSGAQQQDQFNDRFEETVSLALQRNQKLGLKLESSVYSSERDCLTQNLKRIIDKPWFKNLNALSKSNVLLLSSQQGYSGVPDDLVIDDLAKFVPPDSLRNLLNAASDFKSLEVIILAVNRYFSVTNKSSEIFQFDSDHIDQSEMEDREYGLIFAAPDHKGTLLIDNLTKLVSTPLASGFLADNGLSGRHEIIEEVLDLVFYPEVFTGQSKKDSCSGMPHLHCLLRYGNKSEAIRLMTDVVSFKDVLELPDGSKTPIHSSFRKPHEGLYAPVQNTLQNIFLDFIDGPELEYVPEAHLGKDKNGELVHRGESDVIMDGQSRLASALFRRPFITASDLHYSKNELLDFLEESKHRFRLVNLHIGTDIEGHNVHSFLAVGVKEGRIYLKDSRDFHQATSENSSEVFELKNGEVYVDGQLRFRVEDKDIGLISVKPYDLLVCLIGVIAAPKPTEKGKSVRTANNYEKNIDSLVGLLAVDIIALAGAWALTYGRYVRTKFYNFKVPKNSDASVGGVIIETPESIK